MKKTLLAAAACVFMVVSPAFAQSYDPDVGSGNLDSSPYTANPDDPYGAANAYGYDTYYGTYVPAPAHREHWRH